MTNDLVKQAREAADSCKLSTEHMWLVSAMADHIEKLERANSDLANEFTAAASFLRQGADRIKKLEAALRFYAFHGGDIARKALEEKDD